jgi:hypothetical protein
VELGFQIRKHGAWPSLRLCWAHPLKPTLSQRLNRPITDTDLSRFRFYSNRVAFASIGSVFGPNGPMPLWTILRARLLAHSDTARPIFPRLRTLVWICPGLDPLDSQIFFHVGLHAFELHAQHKAINMQPQRFVPAVLDALAPYSAQLRNLRLLTARSFSGVGVDDHLEAFLRSAVRLKTFDMTEYAGGCAPILGLLARMPHLAKLNLSGCDLDALAPMVTGCPPVGTFPVLGSIEGRVREPETLRNLFEGIKSTDLTEIKMWTFGACSAHTFHAIAESLRCHPHRRNSIQVLRLFFQGERYQALEATPARGEDSYTLVLDVLRPILDLLHLTDLWITHPLLVVDDMMLQAIALHLPALTQLSLDNNDAPPKRMLHAPSSPTLAGVATLLSGCPRLRDLTLVVDTSSVHDWTCLPPRPTQRCLLRFLHADIQKSNVEPLVQAFHGLGISLGGPSPLYYFESAREDEVMAMGLNVEEFHAEGTRRGRLWEALYDRMDAIWA